MDSIESLVEVAESSFEKIGLYPLSGSSVGAIPIDGDFDSLLENSADPATLMREGKAKFYVTMTLSIGDVAWSERVLDPDGFAEKQSFSEVAPTEVEMLKEQALQEIQDWFDWDEDE
jgi:hypothetical protein